MLIVGYKPKSPDGKSQQLRISKPFLGASLLGGRTKLNEMGGKEVNFDFPNGVI